MVKKYLNQMFASQKKLNDVVFPGWETANLNWLRAIRIEAAELVDSLDWKWWKKSENDWDNVEVELIDIIHFLVSYTLISNITDVSENFEKAKAYFKTAEDVINLTEELMFNTFMAVKGSLSKRIEAINEMWVNVFSIAKTIGVDIKDIYKKYLGKNALNYFRTTHGYKDGSYKKEWIYKGNIVEDNVVLWDLIKDKDFIDLDELLSELESIYADTVAASN